MAWHGKSRQGKAKHGMGMAWHGREKRDNVVGVDWLQNLVLVLTWRSVCCINPWSPACNQQMTWALAWLSPFIMDAENKQSRATD